MIHRRKFKSQTFSGTCDVIDGNHRFMGSSMDALRVRWRVRISSTLGIVNMVSVNMNMNMNMNKANLGEKRCVFRSVFGHKFRSCRIRKTSH